MSVTMALMLALAAALSLSTAGSAQETIRFQVTKYTCATDPGTISPAAGNIPEDCEGTAGVTFTIEPEGASALSCTTDDMGMCFVQVPNEATVTVTEDTSTAPARYAPRENPIETTAVTEFAGAVFVNLPVDDGNGEPPTQLPDTGIGGSLASGSGLAGTLAVIAVMTLVGGRLTRREMLR